MLRPRHWRRTGVGALAALPAVAASALALAACAPGPVPPLPPPPSTVAAGAPSTVPPDLTGVSVAAVGGETTTTAVGVGGGKSTLSGRVTDPSGAPVPGATVELDRFVGSEMGSAQVTTASDGTWQAKGILGGRYRVRAWRAPNLTMAQADVLFLTDGDTRTLDLALEAFGGTDARSAIAPSPPQVGMQANLAVTLSSPVVEGDGSIYYQPEAAASVELVGTGSWSVSSPNPASTDGSGDATWALTCQAPGDQPLAVQLQNGRQVALKVPACVNPPPPTTTTSTTPPGSTTTSTTSGIG